MENKKQMLRSLTALYAQVPESVANDVKAKFTAYSDEIEGKLLECARNLGHPAYGLSSSNTIAIDELREKTLDFLGVPKL